MTHDARMRVASMLEQRAKEGVFHQAESLIYRAERLVADFDDPMSDQARALIAELQAGVERDDHDQINRKMEELSDVLHKLEAADY